MPRGINNLPNMLYDEISKNEYINEENKTIENRCETIGKTLTYLRLKIGYTQEDVSRAVNIARQTYAGYETGKHEPTVEILIRIAEIYGVSLDLIAGREHSTDVENIKQDIRKQYEIIDSEDYLMEEIIKLDLRDIEKKKYNRVKTNKKKQP